MVSPQDKYRSIAPGQTIEFEFTANYPGVFMYHCGTPMILEHIASGMYGAVVVEPRGGYPTKADREYVIVQSEFYAKPDPERRKVGRPCRSTCSTATVLRRRSPPHRVQRRAQRHGEAAAGRKPGERVRLLRAQRRAEQDLELPRGRHDLRSRVDGGQPGQPVPRHADRAARLVEQRDRGVHDPRGAARTSWSITTSPTPRRAPSASSRRDASRSPRGPRASQHPATAAPSDPATVRAKLEIREQVPGLPLGRRRQEARRRPRRRD